MSDKQSCKVEGVYERIAFPVPSEAYHLDPKAPHYDPARRWAGIDWPNGNFTVHLFTDKEVDAWLRGEDPDAVDDEESAAG